MKKQIISIDACVNALAGAAMQQKRVVHTQMAVGIALFYSLGRIDKKAMQEVYAKAGLDCNDSFGTEYKTVRRKIKTAVVLYKKLGKESIAGCIGDLTNAKAILAITVHLSDMHLDTIEKVLAYCGASSSVPKQIHERQAAHQKVLGEQPTPGEPQHRRSADTEQYSLKFDTRHVHIAVAEEATLDELLETIAKLEEMVFQRTHPKAA
jgi:hypothetical protein